MTKVLLVLTSHEELGSTGRKTGWFVPEAAHPWDVLTRAGVEVEFASPGGGAPRADAADRSDPVQARFLDDPDVQRAVENTTPTADVDPAAYDAVLFVGGHGTMWDFPADPGVQRLAREVWEGGGAVSAVCHGPAALVDVTLADGSRLVAGRTVAAFTDDEERAVELDDQVPFLLASRLKERGAQHTQAENFQPHVEVDGRLVTGQNPQSATGVAEALVRVLREREASAA